MEYASPECRNPQEALVYEMAGPALLSRVIRTVYKDEPAAGIWAFKNNNPPITGDSELSPYSYGNHINVQMPLKSLQDGAEFRNNLNDYAGMALALIATLPLVCGAGIVSRDTSKTLLGTSAFNYRISARSAYTSNAISSAATAAFQKPMILGRNEALSHEKKFWRLQVASMDAYILPASNLVKLTALQVTAEMWAMGVLEPVVLADPVMAFRSVSKDWRSHLDVLGGSSLTALDIQFRYLRQAIHYVKRYGRFIYSPGLQEWMRQLQAFRHSDGVPLALYGRNDWVTKHLLIQKRHPGFADAQLISLGYHGYKLGKDMATSQPSLLLERFAPRGFIKDIETAVLTPPPTRASARSRFVRAAQITGSSVEIDWVRLKVLKPQSSGRELRMLDPAAAYTPGLESLIREMYEAA